MKEISELIKYSRALYDRRLVHASGGNTSVRVGDLVWITQTGAVLGELTQNNLSKVTLDGELLAGGKPSKELPMHLAMYNARSDVSAVIHVHPTNAIAYSTKIPEPILDSIPAYTAAFYVRAGCVPMIDYYPSGSADLHKAVAELSPRYWSILLRQHGVIVASYNLAQAMGILEEIEQCCQIALLTSDQGSPLSLTQKANIDKQLGRDWDYE
jgi:ribulose-5-phosphate 4-epimerase/fuculose-1-phosphate aldolase